MAELYVMAEREIEATAERVYGILADYNQHHPRILPPSFKELKVLEGGVGAGTVFMLRMEVGGRKRQSTMFVAEPEPGRVLTESDRTSSLVTTFTVEPRGERCLTRFETRWQGAKGIRGFFERIFAPRVLRKLYRDELLRLDTYARSLDDDE
ncbi:MAG: SRPBCC family protein [Chloroflexi bacterium]|nr:SRPBCC family protein [Chloroflexota bacterium]